jgi:hypothetical protein
VRAAESLNKAIPLNDHQAYRAGDNKFSSMLGRDASVTHLPNVGLIAQPSEAKFKSSPIHVSPHHISK